MKGCALSVAPMLCPRAMEASKVLWDYKEWKFSQAQCLKAFSHPHILNIKLTAIHVYLFWWYEHQISLWQRRLLYSSIKIMLKTLPPMGALWVCCLFGVFLLFWVRTYFWHLHFHSFLPKILRLFLLICHACEARLLIYHRCMSAK